MNKKTAFDLLIKHLTEYNTQGFIFHSDFIKELRELITKHSAGHEKELFNIMIKQFGFVNTFNTMVNTTDSNEILKGLKNEMDFYSLHIENKFLNFRLLMTFTPENTPVFLVAFFEKSGKKVSSYDKYKPVLKTRYNQIVGEK